MGFLILALFFFLLIIVLINVSKKKRKAAAGLDRIPGPRKLPLIGNLHHMVGRNPLPHRVFRDLARKHGPLMKLQLGELPWLIVSSADVARQVMRTHDIVFSNRHHWRNLKKITMLEIFSVKRVRSYRSLRQVEHLNLARHVLANEGSPVDLSQRAYRLAFEVASQAAIGKKTDEEQKAVMDAITEILKAASGLSLADLYPSSKLVTIVTGMNARVNRLFKQVDSILAGILKQLREQMEAKNLDDERVENLAEVLLKHQTDKDELPLTDGTIKGVLLNMFLAGSDSTATGVEWVMSELIRKPTKLKKATEEIRRVMDGNGYVDESKFDELPYLKLVLKETLRLHPPLALLVPRISSQKCELDGHEIPAQTKLIVNAWALGRDPNYWGPDAEEFNPERFQDSSLDYRGNNLEYIPFGSGRRICPGMNFGLANVEFTVMTLLYHFDWEMPDGVKNEDLDMTETFGVTVRRKNHLMLLPTLKRTLKSAP